MADPTDYTQLDLQNLPPEQAAALARAQQRALAQQQSHALLGILGAAPELQKAGALEYGQAGKEREGGQQTAANVLKLALGEKEATARIKEMELQGKQMMGMLGIAMGRQKLEESHESFQQKIERHKLELAAQRQPTGEVEKDLLNSATWISRLKSMGAPKSLVGLFEEDHKAKVEAIKQMGYMGSGPPGWPGEEPAAPTAAPGGANVSPAVPRAPNTGGGNVSITAEPPTSDLVPAQIPGHPPGFIHRSQIPAFKAKHRNAIVGP